MFLRKKDKSLLELLFFNGLELDNSLEGRVGFDGFEAVEEAVATENRELFFL